MKLCVALAILLVAGGTPTQGYPYYGLYDGHLQNTGPPGFQGYPYYGLYNDHQQSGGPSGFPIQQYPHYGLYNGHSPSTGPVDFPIQGHPFYGRYPGHLRSSGPSSFPTQGYPYFGRYHGPSQASDGSVQGGPLSKSSPYKFEIKINTEDQPGLSFSSNSFPSSLFSVSDLLELLPSLTGSLPGTKGISFSGNKNQLTDLLEFLPSLTGSLPGAKGGSFSDNNNQLTDLLELLPSLTGSLPGAKGGSFSDNNNQLTDLLELLPSLTGSLPGAKGGSFSGNNNDGYKKDEPEDQPALSFSTDSLPSSFSSVSDLLGLLPSLTGSFPGAKGGSFSVDLGSIPGIEGRLTGRISTSLTGAIEGSVSGTVSVMAENDGKSGTTNYEIQDLEYSLSGGPSDATGASSAGLNSGSVFGSLNGSIIVSSTDQTGNVESKNYSFDKLAFHMDGGTISVGDDTIAVGSPGDFVSALQKLVEIGFPRA